MGTPLKLSYAGARDVAISYLCGVSHDYIRERWGVCRATILHNILGKRALKWQDSLVNLYINIDRYKRSKKLNGIRFFMTYNGYGEGFPEGLLIDKEREKNIQDSIERCIIEPRMHKFIHKDTCLYDILDASYPKKALVEKMFVESLIGEKGDEVYFLAKELVTPLLCDNLKKRYDYYDRHKIGLEEIFNQSYSDIKNKIYQDIGTGLLYSNEYKRFTGKHAEMLEKRSKALKKVLGTLDRKERKVIIGRYGLDGKAKTLRELGDSLHLSEERIRQIENKAFRKLEEPYKRRMIESLIETNGRPSYEGLQTEEKMKLPINYFDFSNRAKNALDRLNIQTVGDLCACVSSDKELLEFRGLGLITLDELKRKVLNPLRLSFGI